MYSTCTVTPQENEQMVAWALQTFPCLQLSAQVRKKQDTFAWRLPAASLLSTPLGNERVSVGKLVIVVSQFISM